MNNYSLKKIYSQKSLDFFRQKSEIVYSNDKTIGDLVKSMLEIMYKNSAIGIAAVMVGVHKRVIVFDLQKNVRKKPTIMINPEIIYKSEDMNEFSESSISLDGVIKNIKRPNIIKVSYLDDNFQKHELKAEGLLSTCIQHEIDYLDGKLFFDYLDEEEKNKIIKSIASELKIKNIVEDIDTLRTKCEPVKEITDQIRNTLNDMLEIMYQSGGIGLAANQVGINKCMVVIDLQKDGIKKPIFLINPKITWKSEETVLMDEGCLSVPGCSASIERPAKVKLEYTDNYGKNHEIETDDILARCIQHELDHLDGKLYIDYLSKIKRDMLIKKVKKNLNI